MLSNEIWVTVPFEGHVRSPLDNVLDILLSVPHGTHFRQTPYSWPNPTETRMINVSTQSSPMALHSVSDERCQELERYSLTFEDVYPIFMNLAELTSAAQVEETAVRRLGLSSAILSAACCLKSRLSFNASLQIAFAVNLVSIYSPSSEQQEFAARLFSDWHHSI